MPRFLRSLLFLLLAVPSLRADATLEHARRAEALLGAATWTRVIHVENESAASRYPARFHALVFEVAGLLWFYTSLDGTQSFSLHRGRLAAEKADLMPLLRDIDPGFTGWRVIPSELKPSHRAVNSSLPNGCFIESVAAWHAQLAADAKITEPQLLSYYVDTPSGRIGHTVLTYTTEKGVTVIDPGTRRTRHFPAALRTDAAKLARAVLRAPVARARWVPLEPASLVNETPRMAAGAAVDSNPMTAPRASSAG